MTVKPINKYLELELSFSNSSFWLYFLKVSVSVHKRLEINKPKNYLSPQTILEAVIK